MAVPKCSGCKTEREKVMKPHRELVKLPLAVTRCKDFNKKTMPTYLCAYCDGETTVANALNAHKARSAPDKDK